MKVKFNGEIRDADLIDYPHRGPTLVIRGAYLGLGPKSEVLQHVELIEATDAERIRLAEAGFPDLTGEE